MKINSTMKSRIQQAAILSVALATVILGVNYETQSSVVTSNVEVSSHGTAGIISTMSKIQYGASIGVYTAGTDANNLTILGGNPYGMKNLTTAMNTQDANTNTTGAAEESDAEWADKLMTTVDDYMNVRESASSDSALVGKLRKGDLAVVTGTEGDWTQITSGNLTGYVNNEYVVTGDAAKTLAYDICLVYATSTTGGLRVRESASEDASVVTALSEGERLEVADEESGVDGWTAVKTKSGATAYVKSDYVTVALSTGTGITVEEEQQALAAKKAEEEKKAAAQQPANTVATVQNAPVAASYDDVTLLAALIQAEAGYEPYEGQLAVGAVVVNRLNRGYSGSIYGVIYAPGQFSPAGSGRVAQIAANGPSASCIQAASEALSGVDNTGGATSFRPVRSGRAGVVIGNQVFW